MILVRAGGAVFTSEVDDRGMAAFRHQ